MVKDTYLVTRKIDKLEEEEKKQYEEVWRISEDMREKIIKYFMCELTHKMNHSKIYVCRTIRQ